MKNKAVTVKQIQKLDRIAIGKYGVPSLSLMENAGRGVADEVLKSIKKKKNIKVCVFCGLGNNGGDGFVVARHLINAGVDVKVYLIGKANKLKNDALVNYKILKKCRYAIKEIDKIKEGELKVIKSADCLIDAIFGVGLTREIKEPFKGVMDVINSSKRKVISVDIPSGLDGTSGKVHGVCVKANKTVAFSFKKKGFVVKEGPKFVGKVVVVDIGIPKVLRKRLY